MVNDYGQASLSGLHVAKGFQERLEVVDSTGSNHVRPGQGEIQNGNVAVVAGWQT